MDASDLQDMIALAAGMETDELEEFIQICQSTEDSPPEQLSILSLALHSKTGDMKHLDEALFRAEEAASAAGAGLWSGQDDSGDESRGSTLRLLGVAIARNPKSLLRATQLGLAKTLRLVLEAELDVGRSGASASWGPELVHEACKNGGASVLRVLLERGMDPNARDAENNPH